MILGSHDAASSSFLGSSALLPSSTPSLSDPCFSSFLLHSPRHSLCFKLCSSVLTSHSLALRNPCDEPFSETLQETKLRASQSNIHTYLCLLRDCCESRALDEGLRLHQGIVNDGYDRNRLLANTLIQLYGRCGAFTRALDLFNHMHEKNVYTWTIMLGACVDCGEIEDALEIFSQMPDRTIVAWNVIILACVQHGFSCQARQYYQDLMCEGTPDKITFLNILPLCNANNQLSEGVTLHGQIVKTGLECDITVANALLNMYSKCGNLEKVVQMFKKIPQHDLCTWNTMISAYTQLGQGKDALPLFPEMQKEGISPDHITYVGLIDACAASLESSRSLDIHKHVVADGFEPDVIVGTALVHMYGKCSGLESAKRSFNKMFHRDLFAWNALMEAYAQHGDYDGAFQLLSCMQLEGFQPDVVTIISLLSSCTSARSLNGGRQIHKYIQVWGLGLDVILGNSLLNMYGKCGCLDEASMVFGQMTKRNVISWNAMITACVQCRKEKMALDLFQDMIRQRVIPDGITLLGVIDACASQAVLSDAKPIHGYIKQFRPVLDAMIGSALIKMYSKCGSLEDAQMVFDETAFKDVILWNTMISSYAQHGLGDRALQIFEDMKSHGVKPNEATLSIVLSACSHAGLASRGRQYFLEIVDTYGIMPTRDHFNSLIDLFGRSGQISDVENLMKGMPVQPNTTSWLTFLSACKQHSDTQARKVVADQVLECDSRTVGPYVLYANIGESQHQDGG